MEHLGLLRLLRIAAADFCEFVDYAGGLALCLAYKPGYTDFHGLE